MSFPKELVQAGFAPGQATAVGGGYVATTAAGSSQTDATLITASLTVVASADGNKGVILPAVEPGSSCVVFNNSASTLKVYPPSGAAIAVNGTGLGTGNAAFSHLTYKTAMYTCLTSTQWVVNVSA